MKDWRDLSVLIAGCGSIGKRHARVLKSLGVRRIRALDVSEAQRAGLKAEVYVEREYGDYETALGDKQDVVLLCTPADLHISMAIRALESGSAVFSEKPLAYVKTGLAELKSVLERTNLPFAVAFCFRHHEVLAEAKRIADGGEIGKVRTLRLRMSENLADVRPDYRNLATLTSGGVYDLTHEIDLVFWLAGRNAKLEEVRMMDGVVSDLGFTRPDFASLSLRLSNEVRAQVYLDFFSVPRTRVTEIMGSEGTVKVEFADWNEATLSVYRKKTGAWETTKTATERDFMFREEDEEFLRFAAGEAVEPACPLEEAEKSLEILHRAFART